MANSLKENLLQKKIDRYEGLIELGQLVSSSLDYRNIRKKAEGKIKKLLDCEFVHIYRYNETSKKLERNFTKSGHKENSTELISVKVNEKSFLGASAYLSTIIHSDDIKNDLRIFHSPNYLKKSNFESILIIPLLAKGEILGVVEAINSKHISFNDEDIHFAEAIANQITLGFENAKLYEKLKKQFHQVIEALADSIGKKDAYTGGHTKRVGHFAQMIGKELSLGVQEMDNLILASILHDIGKIGIEDKILKKKSPLTDKEFVIMKEHPRLGYEILGHIESLKDVIDGMRFHHERPDGKGYPFGLRGNEIPLIAMIISVADSFDAMISTRPYRKGMPPMLAWQEILKNRGTQFSEKVVDAFDKAFKKTKMYREDDFKNKKVA